MTLQTQNAVLIIAEAGSNWKCGTYDDDMECAKKLIDVAAESGCDAIKFQTFRPVSYTHLTLPTILLV